MELREEIIQRWTDVAQTVFWAEARISDKWTQKFKEAKEKSKEEQEKFANEYCRAIAMEITNYTTDEELEAIYLKKDNT